MRNISIILMLLFLNGCISQKEDKLASIVLIPKPQQIERHEGHLALDNYSTLYADKEFKIAEDFLRKFLQNGTRWEFQAVEKAIATIKIEKNTSLPPEGYSLFITDKNITINAADSGGAFYAVQTLRQLLPQELERSNSIRPQPLTLPQVSITDAPQFSYRGMHLDVSRHFFPKEFIKEYISNMAMLKMNYFHWHLTDDQGWRIEILQYPDLTNHGSTRAETLVGHFNDSPQQFDGKRYAGYYTQDDIREVVEFAAKHNVTIIPEIEMPGHAQAAISAYPGLGCTGKKIAVATKWGVFENVFCPNDKTFTFLKNVLSEVMELFPGEYIHIGGDEAPKTQWKKCNHCQKLIKDLNLKDEHGLQSYFIREIEAAVNDKGKKIIGWDEILEGGLAPNATVMSWRGTDGGVAAAQQNHDVIMTPTSHAYFDYYQSEHPDEPLAIGGYLPLQKVYSFNPIPSELTQEERKYILGAQGNVWTEYMSSEDKVEYMAFPRILAMSEVVWSGASENLPADYSNFLSRLEPFMKRLDALNINYANHLYVIEGRLLKQSGKILYELSTPTEGKVIRYSINSSEEKLYSKPIEITSNSTISANIYKNGKKIGRGFSEEIIHHKGIRAGIGVNGVPHKAYSAGGIVALINGIKGSDSRYGDKEWLGFWGDDVEVTIHLEQETEINMVSLRFYNANGQWIYAPKEVSVSTQKLNGKEVTCMRVLKPLEGESIVEQSFPFDAIKISSIVITIPSYGIIPDGKQGAGNKAWTFIDEIIIE